MPNSKQSIKRMKTDEKRRVMNKTLATSMKTAVKKVMSAEDAATAAAALPIAMKKIDKAAKANVIHDNTAARKKAQLAKIVKAKQA
jgi:small subunit ribosomal protein S20